MRFRHALLDGDLLLAGGRVSALAGDAHRLDRDLVERLPGGKDEAVLELRLAGQLPRQRLHGAPFDTCDARDLFQRAQVGLVVQLGPTWCRDEHRLHRQVLFPEVLLQLAREQVARRQQGHDAQDSDEDGRGGHERAALPGPHVPEDLA